MVSPSLGFHFFGCFSFGRFFERAERFVPEPIEPATQSLDPSWIHSVDPAGTLRAIHNQMRRFEYPQVLGDCGTAHVHPSGDLAHRSCAAAQALEYESASGISQCVQYPASVSHNLL
jgi:hypothetical protein